jgi:hypothetical protein
VKDKGYAKSSGAGTLSDVSGGPTRGGKGSKSSTEGKDTGGSATNKIMTLGCRPKILSPSAEALSKNK